MAIEICNAQLRTLRQPIYVDGLRVREVRCEDAVVYPDTAAGILDGDPIVAKISGSTDYVFDESNPLIAHRSGLGHTQIRVHMTCSLSYSVTIAYWTRAEFYETAYESIWPVVIVAGDTPAKYVTFASTKGATANCKVVDFKIQYKMSRWNVQGSADTTYWPMDIAPSFSGTYQSSESVPFGVGSSISSLVERTRWVSSGVDVGLTIYAAGGAGHWPIPKIAPGMSFDHVDLSELEVIVEEAIFVGGNAEPTVYRARLHFPLDTIWYVGRADDAPPNIV